MKKPLLQVSRLAVRMLIYGLLCLAWASQANAQCLNHALDFDGIDDVVTCNLTTPLGNSDFTFEAWVTSTAMGSTANCTGLNSFRRLIELANSGLAPNRIDLGECNGYVTVAWQDFFGFHGPIATTGFIRDNQWHHIAMVKTTGQIKVYLDCVLIFTATDYSTVGNFFITNVTLGATPFNGPNYWQGRVDEVRLWPIAHTDVEICNERFCPVTTKFMTLYWPMDEGVPGANNSTITQVGVTVNKGNLSNFLLLPGSVSNFVCSGSPMTYPNYFPLHAEIKDPINQNQITDLCSGEAAHFCLLNPDGTSPAPAANTVITWEQSEDSGSGFGPYTPVSSSAFSTSSFCFIVPKDNILLDCANSTRGYVDRHYRAIITVTDGVNTCEFFTGFALLRICCPVTDATVQMTVSPGSLLNGTLCEGDVVDVDVSLTSATHPFIHPPGGALNIIWAPPFSSHNG